MSNETDICITFCTVPDEQTGKSIADDLVGHRLAACVNVIPGIESIYEWEGELVDDSEVLLVIKTRVTRFENMKNRIREIHPYDVPEIIAIPVQAGHEPYMNWVRANTSSTDSGND